MCLGIYRKIEMKHFSRMCNVTMRRRNSQSCRKFGRFSEPDLSVPVLDIALRN